ncbi:MAG: hypothetical protein IRZ19_12985 [Pyrinomonas methylaliphatogenes]|nr:hypothetical protein [Pyrinomonas methylaliphatogenes]
MKDGPKIARSPDKHPRRAPYAIIYFALGLFALLQPSCTRKMESPTPKRASDIVRVEVTPIEMRAGDRAEAKIKVIVADGYHINANPPTYDYLKATELQVSSTDSIAAGPPVYPPAIKRKFSFAPDPLAVYEGADTVIKLPLRAAQTARGKVELEARLRAQACDDQTCYPPREIRFAIPITVR